MSMTFSTGSTVQWLRDGLGIIESAEDIEALALERDSTDGVFLVPAFMNVGKKETHVHCPYQYQEFGGTIPYVTLLETNKTPHNGRCFPAGHASGGFSLLLGNNQATNWVAH